MTAVYVLALDQGTTGSTALVVDRFGSVTGRGYAELTQHYPHPGWVEHDPEEIWQCSLDAMRAALADADLDAGAIAAVGITNQRETTVLWERGSGRPVHPAIVWQDRRTADQCRSLYQDGRSTDIRTRTGLVIDPYFSATKIAWLLDHGAGLRARAERGEIAFGTIDTWLLWKLSGGAVHATDVSNASRTLLFNIHDLAWDETLLDLFRIPAAILPAVQASSRVYAQTASGLFPGNPPIPLAGIAGDQQAALFGQACFDPGQAKCTTGTGSFILMNIGTKPVTSRHDLLTTIAWQLGDAPVEYAIEGAVFVTGAAVQWLRDGLGVIAGAAETEALAASLAGNDDVYFVPALTGLGAPHWDAYARGTILGLTRGTTRAHLVRATLESIAYQSRDVIQAMQRDSGVALAELRCDGGAAANGFLMQFQADLLGVPVLVPEVTETTALGAAMLAGLAVGLWRDQDEIAANWRLGRRYWPGMEADRRQRLYQRWLQAVERAKGWVEASGDGPPSLSDRGGGGPAA
jgi:glycerol kinase